MRTKVVVQIVVNIVELGPVHPQRRLQGLSVVVEVEIESFIVIPVHSVNHCSAISK